MTSNVKTRKLKASSFLKWGVILIICVIIGLWGLNRQRVLVISNQETGEIYAVCKVDTDDKVTYEWIHSFEHIPWYEDYRITADSQLALEEIRVAGFGAGIPENKGTTTVKDGMVVMTDLTDVFDHIQWFNSHTALQFIAVNNRVLVKGTDMPHHEGIELRIKGRVIQWLRL